MLVANFSIGLVHDRDFCSVSSLRFVVLLICLEAVQVVSSRMAPQ